MDTLPYPPHSVTVAVYHRKALIPNVCKIHFTVKGSNLMKGEWYLESISYYFYTIEATAAVCYGELKVVARLNGVAARLWTCNKRITGRESIDSCLYAGLPVLCAMNAVSSSNFCHVSTGESHFQDLLIFWIFTPSTSIIPRKSTFMQCFKSILYYLFCYFCVLQVPV
jgi:hypothetical protein